MSRRNRLVTKDMYWFAQGGAESNPDKSLSRNVSEGDEEKISGENVSDRKGVYEEQKSSYSKDVSLTDGSNSSGPPSLERDDRLHAVDKRIAVEERRKLMWEAEQERNDAVMRKHMEREAALEARRNAQRSTISFAFGSSVPRNVDTLLSANHNVDATDIMSRSFTAGSSSHRAEHIYDRRSVSPIHCGGPHWVDRPHSPLPTYSEKKINSGCLVGSGALIVEDVMSKSMIVSATRGRRKNDLMPTVPYERTAAPRVATSSSSRRRSVSMTRLDQLALPRKHYVEATKANSTASSGTSSLLKDVCSPNRPLSSASEQSGGRANGNVTHRVRPTPRKPRPVSIAGTIPDHKLSTHAKLHEVRPARKTYTPLKKTSDLSETKKASTPTTKSSVSKSADKPKPSPKPATSGHYTPPVKTATPKTTTSKPSHPTKSTAQSKKADSPPVKEKLNSPTSTAAKLPSSKNAAAVSKKNEIQVSSVKSEEVKMDRTEKGGSPLPDSDGLENDKNSKRIISEEEAKAALAERRKLAREQAEREAELERQRQEELRRQEEERLRQEEEEQRKMEEESMRLLEEHRRQEEEKLRKAIEDQEHKEEEERFRREEESRLKAEQDRKAKEEAEKVRIELEEKLRKEEEERAERKKRLEKIMSRTRGKSSGTSPSGSVSGSDHLDSGDNQQEGFSSGANSLESNEGGISPGEPVSSDDAIAKVEVSSGGSSLEGNLTYEFSSNDVSLNSNDLMLPTSQENSMALVSDKGAVHQDSDVPVTPVNVLESESHPLFSEAKLVESSSPLTLEEEKTDASVGGSQAEVDVVINTKSEELTEVEAKPLDESFDVDNVKSNLQELSNECNKEEIKDATFESPSSSNDQINSEWMESGDKTSSEHEDAAALNRPSDIGDVSNDDLIKEASSQIAESNFGQENFEASVKDALLSEAQLEGDLTPTTAALTTTSQQEGDTQNPFSNSLHQEVSLSGDAFPKDQDFTEQPRELEENVIQFNLFDGEKNIFAHNGEAALPSEPWVDDAFGNSPFIQNPILNDAGGDVGEIQNHSPFSSNFEGGGDASEAFNFSKMSEVAASVDNPFLGNYETEQSMFSADPHSKESAVLEPEHILFEEQNVEKDELDNVTLIKQEGGEKYIGIISSIDNDHLSNNYPTLKEQLVNNIDCASTTDSEDSSLDSNLSQVIVPDNNTDCNNLTNSFAKASDHQGSNNTGHFDNPFSAENHLNQSSIPQTGVDHYSTFEVYSNGHGMESDHHHRGEYIDGNGILDVDHPKSNIFESVDAIDFSKISSSDPFLAKGSSNQIPGNPFLLQEH